MRHHVQNYIARMGRVQMWQLAVAIVVFGGLFVYGMRVNNSQMGQLKQIVIEADKRGEGTYESLARLANHVFDHMNTSTEINLNETYQRAVTDAIEATYATGNQTLYDRAVELCNRPGVLGVDRAACVEEYILENAAPGQNPQAAQLPLAQNYKYEFAAPTWSPDLAGFSLIAMIVSAVWLAERLIKRKLRY